MSNSYADISNLLSEYTHRFDLGNLEGAAQLFRHARVQTAPDTWIDYKQLLDIWREGVIMYDDGTPKTKHVCTNAVINIDEDNDAADSKSYYVVYQQTDRPFNAVRSDRCSDHPFIKVSPALCFQGFEHLLSTDLFHVWDPPSHARTHPAHACHITQVRHDTVFELGGDRCAQR